MDSLCAVIATRIASRAGAPGARPSEYLTRSPRALRLFLVGEQAERAGRWDVAADSLDAAIALDSSFAVAMLRRSDAASFGADEPKGGRLVLMRN